MSEHYFVGEPSSKHQPAQIRATLRGRRYTFWTDAGVFSRKSIDFGTRLLIENLPCRPGEIILDLGCGYGPLGIVAADLVGPQGHAYLVDINKRAVELAAKNAAINGISNATVLQSDGLQALSHLRFHCIFSNPPVRAGKEVVYRILKEAHQALHPGGCLLVVIRTKQGAKSLERYLVRLAGNAHTLERKSGYRILRSCKGPLA